MPGKERRHADEATDGPLFDARPQRVGGFQVTTRVGQYSCIRMATAGLALRTRTGEKNTYLRLSQVSQATRFHFDC